MTERRGKVDSRARGRETIQVGSGSRGKDTGKRISKASGDKGAISLRTNRIGTGEGQCRQRNCTENCQAES